MGIRDQWRAKVRGDISVAELVAYGRASSDAYDLMDSLPVRGVARAAAWNAFFLQTFADNLLASSPSPGFIAPDTADFVRVLYELAGGWLGRARQAAASETYRLDVYLPQELPHRWQLELRSVYQLVAMRTTLESGQARLAGDLSELDADKSVYPQLKALLSAIDAAVDYASKLWTLDPGVELRETLGVTLQNGLDTAYQLGQFLALPQLVEPIHAPSQAPAARSVLRMILPGETGFDPWCLTDPIQRRLKEHDARSSAAIDQLWHNDPSPERTLAIHAEIDSAQAEHAIEYLPTDDGIGTLNHLAARCPWPGVMYATRPLLIGGHQINPGDSFVYTVGGEPETFERAIVTRPAKASAQFTENDVDMHKTGLPQLLVALAEAGLIVNHA